MMKFILFFILFALLDAHKNKDDESVPTYFRTFNKNGKLVNRASKDYDRDIPKPFITKILRTDADAVLKASPSVVDNGGNVTVRWSGVVNPTDKDYVALYCPADDKPDRYLDFFHVTVDSQWSKGMGAYSVNLFNMRTSCDFKYFRSGKASQLVATSNPISFTNGPLQPLQVHISLTNDPTQMRVMWVSGKAKSPFVKYGTSASLEQTETKFTVDTYKGSDLCMSPANDTGFRDPGYIYDVVLTKLEPNTKYYYVVGNEGEGRSQMQSFLTALPPGDRTPFKFLAYGDQGIDTFPQGQSTALHAIKDITDDENYRFVYHNGDISYALGNAYIWEQWFAMIQPYASRVPYMVGIGNHEYDHTRGGEKHDPSGVHSEGGFSPPWGNYGDDSHGECGVPMYHRFHMPDTGNKLWWYSYDYGMVHMVMLSTEHDYSPESDQYKWLEKDLQGVNRAKTPWVIIGGHRAMYCSSLIPGDYVVALNMQRFFEDLIYKYKVDLAFWAHYHSYERTCRVYRDECQPSGAGGITHMVIGNAGRSSDPDFWLPKPWSVFHHIDYGYGRMSVLNETHMHWEWVLNKSGEVIDNVYITK